MFTSNRHCKKIAYVSKKVSTCFGVKDVNEFKHSHDVIYQGKCPEIGCNDHYLGENGRRISKRVLDHAGRDQNGHPVLHMNNYKILEKGYKNNVRKRKIAEALLIKEIKHTLNKQDNSIELKLFN